MTPGGCQVSFSVFAGVARPWFINARDRNRTGTVLPPQDFKSCASTCSATRALQAAAKITELTQTSGKPAPALYNIYEENYQNVTAIIYYALLHVKLSFRRFRVGRAKNQTSCSRREKRILDFLQILKLTTLRAKSRVTIHSPEVFRFLM